MALPTRRQAMISAASAIAAAQPVFVSGFMPSSQQPSKPIQPNQKQKFCVFTKPFCSLSFDELADRIAELGFDGLEAPIREQGHLEPERVEDELPKLVEALKKRNLEISIITSDVNNATDPIHQRVLKTAAGLGIRRYRMKYLTYDLKRPVIDQIKQWQSQLRDLAAFNRELGIIGLYQNHASNKNLGAVIWDLHQVLEGIAVEEIGIAYDIRHAAVEGGQSWPISFNLIRSKIDTVYVKDFRWEGNKVINVPLGQGWVDPAFFKMLAESVFQGPISLHEEYLDHRQPELVPDHLAAIKQDFQTLKQMMKV